MENYADQFNAVAAGVLVGELEKNLNEQIQLNRQYMIDKAMEKANSCATLMAAIKKEKILERPDFAARKKAIKKLYKDLELIITVNQQEVSQKLNQIRTAKKTLNAYAGNI